VRRSVSIIIPVLNEAEAIPHFMERFNNVISNLEYDFEFIFVNDGSSDGTMSIINSYIELDERVRCVELSRNYGKEVALTAGLDYALGDCAIPMDVDLQDPPDIIVEMLSKWESGFDVVYGVRVSRRSDSSWKKFTSGWFYKVFNVLSDTKIPENAGDFRLLDRKVLKALSSINERNRFMKGIFSWVGFNQTAVYFEREARVAGRTKWRYWRLWNLAMDGVFSFSSLPLKVWTYVGVFIALLSFMYGCGLIVKVFFTGIDVPGYASIVVAILFVGGVQLITLGLIGEYIGRIYTEVKGRPLYVVKSILNSGNSSERDNGSLV
jgi:glycosyltransferase involved in cell wall biosynthesis